MRHSKIGRHRLVRIGLPPGTLIPQERPLLSEEPITLFTFKDTAYTEESFQTLPEKEVLFPRGSTTWLNLENVSDAETLETLGAYLNIHPLTLEDIQNTDQRSKIEEFDNYLYLSFKMLTWDADKSKIDQEQVSLILGKGYVVSFQEKPGDVFNPIRERIRSGKGRIRREGADYLAYTLIDSAVDHYFLILENLDLRLDELEERVIIGKQDKLLEKIHDLRREVVFLKRTVWPLADMLNLIRKEELSLIKKTTRIFFKDVLDHVVQAQEMIDLLRDNISGVLDYHVTDMNNMMGKVMKVLTIIATIFIPLTFIVGIYGMNFHNMPELGWRFGYPAILVFMGLLAGGMVLYFKGKKWM